ncbi:MAG TPA: ketopantoate reductase C-terminal domain-containing protein, partial [Reyranellaceae bacterium]|nr:ketopantoate reductase C-terminal domain-containing protein [Reyranellaceae bacterium]
LIRQPIGRLREDADIVALMRAGYQETVDVGRARGVRIPDDAVERALAWNRSVPPTLLPSMAVDLIRGNRIELPWLSGKLVELGRELGVPTPTHSFMYTALKPYIMGAPN